MEFGVRFYTIFKCLGGAAGSSFGDIFRFSEACFCHVISDTFLFSRFCVAFGLLRASFWRPFGGSRLWQKQYPRLHGSYVFNVLSGQKHGFFRHRFRRGSRRRFFRHFGVFWAPLESRRLHFGHYGALSRRRNFGRIFGAKMMVFWDLPQPGKIVSVGGDGLARGEKSILGHDIGTMLRES